MKPKTDTVEREASRRVRTIEDKVAHIYRTPFRIEGFPSLCGLVRMKGPVAQMRQTPPSNVCSICEEIWKKETSQ